jgi:hypothetical protein
MLPSASRLPEALKTTWVCPAKTGETGLKVNAATGATLGAAGARRQETKPRLAKTTTVAKADTALPPVFLRSEVIRRLVLQEVLDVSNLEHPVDRRPLPL